MNAAASYAFIDDETTQALLQISPSSILEGKAPRLLDEWQVEPSLWNAVRRAVDSSRDPGRFLLTGSALPADDSTRHTGAGRFLRLRQRTMSWFEKLPAAQHQVSLQCLFAGERPAPYTGAQMSLQQVIDALLTPGFPAMTELSPSDAARRLTAYAEDIARSDIPRLADIRHRPAAVTRLIRALGRSVASEVTYKTLAADVAPVAAGIRADTIAGYVELLERLFVVERQEAWTPTLRSRARLRVAPKLHLLDPAFAAASLGAGAEALVRDPTTLGLLFESAVFHDLSCFVGQLGGEVRHFRDSNGRELDAVLTLPDGRWAAVEVKLGATQAPAGLTSLNAAVDTIDTASVGEPSFRLVITGTGPTLVAEDGAVVTSLRSLAP